MAALSAEEINRQLGALPEWKIVSGKLARTFQFENFIAALGFVNLVGALAEKAGHHPDIDIRYNKVHLALITHDAGGLTAKDFKVALWVDELV